MTEILKILNETSGIRVVFYSIVFLSSLAIIGSSIDEFLRNYFKYKKFRIKEDSKTTNMPGHRNPPEPPIRKEKEIYE